MPQLRGNEPILGLNTNLLKLEQVEWYKDIIFYLKNLSCPRHLVGHKKRALRLKSSKYVLTRDGLGLSLDVWMRSSQRN
jgi:hypothetical protein